MSVDNIGRILRTERLHITVATAAGLAVAMLIAVFTVGGGNPIKTIMEIVGVALMVVATVNPRIGLALLLVSSTCLDFIKRFLILFGIGTMGDVAGVLSVAPIILVGTFLGTCVLHPIFSKRMLDKQERRLVFFSLILIGASVASGMRIGDLDLSVLGGVANKSAYSLLLPIIYVLYRRRSSDDISRLLRFVAIIFVPVAIYGIHQYIFGLCQFEIDYLRSGLTMTEGNLYDVHPRAFSTLNSPHAFSVSMGILALLSIVLCSRYLRSHGGFFSLKVRWGLPAIFITASFLSFGRAGWIVFVLGMICMVAFRTRARTIAFYSIFAVSFSLLVWKADVIYASLGKIQAYLPMDSDIEEQAFRLGTYSERLYGFQNVFRNRAMWSWFGVPSLAHNVGQTENPDEVVHDALGQILVTYGFVGLFALLLSGSLALFFLHRRILVARHGPVEILERGLLSIWIAVFASGLLTGGHVSVFPVNVLFWATIGTLTAVTERQTPTEIDLKSSTTPVRTGERMHAAPRQSAQ